MYIYPLRIKPETIEKDLNGHAFPAIIEETMQKSVFIRLPFIKIDKFLSDRKFGPLKNEYDLVKAVQGWCEYNEDVTVENVETLLNLIDSTRCKLLDKSVDSFANIKNKNVQYLFKQKNIAIVILDNHLVRELVQE